MKTLLERWNKQHEDSIETIHTMLNSDKECDEEFIRIARALMQSKVNPYSFMPEGYQESFGTSTGAEYFVHALHHAMVDDGEITLISDGIDFSFTFRNMLEINDTKRCGYHNFFGKELDNFIIWLSDKALDARNKQREEWYNKLQESFE